MPQRKLDVVLDSVKRLQRMGATSNLVNLLHKQHPADLAQLFSELSDKERRSAFSLLAERNSKLAMEALSELGPEAGAALVADRSAEEIVKLLQELPSDDAAAIVDYLPEDLSSAVLELLQKRPGEVGELLEYAEQTAGRIMNPKVFALAEDLSVSEAITALQASRDVEMLRHLEVSLTAAEQRIVVRRDQRRELVALKEREQSLPLLKHHLPHCGFALAAEFRACLRYGRLAFARHFRGHLQDRRLALACASPAAPAALLRRRPVDGKRRR